MLTHLFYFHAKTNCMQSIEQISTLGVFSSKWLNALKNGMENLIILYVFLVLYIIDVTIMVVILINLLNCMRKCENSNRPHRIYGVIHLRFNRIYPFYRISATQRIENPQNVFCFHLRILIWRHVDFMLKCL